MTLVSVIIPAYNEQPNLLALHERLCQVAGAVADHQFEFLFVDDGSSDPTPEILASLRARDFRVKALRFSRNFGSHAACLAGLLHAKGDLLVILAADLQDPPELIPQMLEKVAEGFDVVLAVRSQREDPWLTVQLADLYHRLMRRYAIPTWPARGADVVMMRRPVRDVVVSWPLKNTSLFGQVLWAGFRQTSIYYAKQRRQAGRSKWSLGKKIKLFVDSFVSFSFAPIRFISYAGMALFFVGSSYAAFIAARKLFFGRPVPGWTSLMVVLLLVSGLQFLMLGVIGEYLWRIVDQVRGTPPFVIQSRLGIEVSDQVEREFWKEEVSAVREESIVEGRSR